MATIGLVLEPVSPDCPLPAKTLARLNPLHMASLALQLLCAGLLPYEQAYVGAIRPFFVDTPVREPRLLGRGRAEDGGVSGIRARLEELTCLPPVTKGPVLVF